MEDRRNVASNICSVRGVDQLPSLMLLGVLIDDSAPLCSCIYEKVASFVKKKGQLLLVVVYL